MLSYEEKAKRAEEVRGKRVSMEYLQKFLPETWVLLKDVERANNFTRDIVSAVVVEVETSEDWDSAFAKKMKDLGKNYMMRKTTFTPGLRW